MVDQEAPEHLGNEKRLVWNRQLKERIVSDGIHNSSDEFWEQFADHLSTVSEPVSFDTFMAYFDPRQPASFPQRVYEGAYYPYYQERFFTLANNMRRLNPNLKYESYRDLHRIIYDAAPPSIRAMLSTVFLREFDLSDPELLFQQGVMPRELRPLFLGLSLLRTDSKATLMDPLTGYISVKQRQADKLHIPEGSIQRLVTTAVNRFTSSALRERPINVLELMEQDAGLFQMLSQEAVAENPSLREAAASLLERLRDSYYPDVTRGHLYRAAVLYWDEYHQNSSIGHVLFDSHRLSAHLHDHVSQAISNHETEDPPYALGTFLDKEVLPEVYSSFAELAAYAPGIRYFTRKDAQGNPKHLFLHQVETIKKLEEQYGGIVAHEPGTGKTIAIALYALRLMDTMRSQPDECMRAVVVGSKSVNDTWEKELALHVEVGVAELVNINFTRELGTIPLALSQRLSEFANRLSDPKVRNQFILVNYDLFRNPTFFELMRKYRIGAVIVDEAHNVKARFIEALNQDKETKPASNRVARRTRGLYSFILANPSAAVIFSTSTPYVKERVEPLIMAHLVQPSLVPIDEIKELARDPVATNRTLQRLMLRRRKEEIAVLPPKETRLVPIDMNKIARYDQDQFLLLAQRILKRTEEPGKQFARFFSLLSLEAQAKYPWMINTIKDIISQGRRALVFTPFVEKENRLTAAISTKAIANRLRATGITSLAILDGSLDAAERATVQELFLRPSGPMVLIGNYQTAGESYTLCSPQNHATDVIIFVSPNSIHRYIHAVDRIHRYGQTEPVTIHIPYLVGDLLERSAGTYDERVIERLMYELSEFEGVVDGLFYVGAADIFRTIVQAEEAKLQGDVHFEEQILRKRGIERISLRRRDRTDGLWKPKHPDIPLREEESIDGEVALAAPSILGSSRVRFVYDHDPSVPSPIDLYIREIRQYPRLTHAQRKVIFEYLKSEMDIEWLKHDEWFQKSIPSQDSDKYLKAFSESKSIADFLYFCSLGLVPYVAKDWPQLPLLDAIQEGNFGLKRAIELFDHTQGVKFSTYAVAAIRSSIRNAIRDTGLMIHIPGYIQERIAIARRLIGEYQARYGKDPTKRELHQILKAKTKFNDYEISSILETLKSGMWQNTLSLDRMLELADGEAQIEYKDSFSLMQDPEAEVVWRDTWQRRKQIIEQVLQANLTPSEQAVIRARFGLDKSELGEDEYPTLQEVGNTRGLTRQRIHQIEVEALEKLRHTKEELLLLLTEVR